MKRFNWDRKYVNWGLTAFIVIAGCILFYMALSYLPAITTAVRNLVSILSPFIWGIAITYLMQPLTKILHLQVFTPLVELLKTKVKLRKDGKSLARGCAAGSAIIVFILCVTLLIYMIIPQAYSSIKTIVDNSPTYMTSLTQWVSKLLNDYPELENLIIPKLTDYTANFMNWIQNKILPGLGTFATNITTGVISVVKSVYNVVIGVIVAIYLLYSYDSMLASIKRALYALFPVASVSKFLEGVKFVNETFVSFLSGKILDSAIIAVICYVGCVFLKMPYALLISLIIGCTNIIPFFGPFIGAIPSILFILMISPIKALIFAIFILILQQVDGNIIGPRILGSSLGLNGFWIMFSIILGAGLFGFWGMLLGVPVFVVVYTGVGKVIEKKLKRNGLPVETVEYENLNTVNPDTLEFVRYPEVPKAELKPIRLQLPDPEDLKQKSAESLEKLKGLKDHKIVQKVKEIKIPDLRSSFARIKEFLSGMIHK